MRRWLCVGIFLLISSLLFGFQRGADSITIVGGGYRLERVRIGNTTTIPNARQKLFVVRFALPKGMTQLSAIEALDARGTVYPLAKGSQLAVLASADDEPQNFRAADRNSLREGSVLMATFLMPSATVIDKVRFGSGRTATTVDVDSKVGGLDYYVESGVTPVQTISASRGEWYVSGGFDLRFDGWTTKTGMIGEIEGTEEGEAFVIGAFSVRNQTTETLNLFSPDRAELPFTLETTSGETVKANETILQSDSDHGLEDFSVAPGSERSFRVFWKTSRTARPKAFGVVEKTLGVDARPMIWPADGKGLTSSRKNSSRGTTPSSELDAEPSDVTGVRVSASGLVKKFPNLVKTLQVGKVPNFNGAGLNLGGITIPAEPIVVGPTLEGKIFPKGKFEAKATGTKITVDADGETKIVPTLQVLSGGKVVREQSGKSISLTCPKNSTYRITFGLSVGTPPGTYTGRFLVNDGVKRSISVTFIIAAKSGGVVLSPAFGSVPVLEAGSSITLPFNVQLQGNARSKVTFALQNGVKGLSLSGSPLTLDPGESRIVNLTLTAADTAQNTNFAGDEVRIVANAVDLKSSTSVSFKLLIEPMYGVFEYHGKIGNVTYSANLLFKASGDWCWTVSASTSSKISGDTLIQCLCLNFADQGYRHYIQVAFPLGAKVEKLPGSLTYIASGNDPWILNHFGDIFDAGFGAKLARIDNGILSFTNDIPFDPGSSAPAKYIQWMASRKCKFSLKPSFTKLIK